MGQYVSIAASDGSGRFDAYLALPASGKGPGVVIGQEIFGVNANMRAVADLYAEEGYVALVPDLFSGGCSRASTWATTKRPSPRPSSCSSASTWTPRWTTSPPVSSTCANARR